MATADLLLPLDFQKIPCPRCRLKLEYAQKLINCIPSVNRSDVVSVCDHCLLKTKTEGPCHKCANIVNKFLAARGEQEKYKHKYFKSWLTKTEHQMNESISKIKPRKTIQRSYSEININLPSRDTSKTVIKCEVQKLFHSELNLTDTNRKKEIKQPKNLVPGLEKTVNFTDLIEMFHTARSDSVVKNSKTERDSLYEHNEYYDLKLRSSSDAENIRSSIAKTSQKQDETEQMLEEKETYLRKHKISNKDKFGAESEKSFVFPQTKQKSDKNLKRYISSPELIQDIRANLRLKAEEEEKEKKEEIERKAEEEKMKKLAREETKLKKDDQLHQEAFSKAKFMDAMSKIDKSGPLKPEAENVRKYSKREDNKMIQQEVIEKQGTKEKEASSNELESHKRLGNDKAAEFDKEKLVKSKMDDQKERKLEPTQVKELTLFKVKEKLDKHKRAEDIKEKETLIPADKDKVSKLNKHEDLKEKQLLISDVKQLARTKGRDTDKPKKDENLKENELQVSNIKHLAKVKKMESKNEKYTSTVNKLEGGTDITPELTRKREGALKDVAGLEKKAEKSEGIDKISKLTPKKGGVSKDVAVLEKKAEKSDGIDLISDLTRKRERASKDVAGVEKKAEKPEGIDVISELTRKREKVSKDVAGHEKKGGDIPSNEIHKLSKGKPDKVKEIKEVKGDEKNRDALHPTEISKSKKANNLEDSKQNDIKLIQVKLLKPSADDLVTQLIKVNNKALEKDSIKPKLPELSKLILETTKRKEKLDEKRTSTPKAKPKDDTLDLPSKAKQEKQEKELKMSQVKLVESNFDNLILRLIKIRSTTGERSVKVHKIEALQIKKRHRFGGTATAAEQDQDISEEFILREEKKSLGREGEQAPICPPQREGQEIKPIYVQLKLSDISSLAPLQSVEEAQLETEDGKKASGNYF